jgi:Flp pilus assembly protein TadD
VHDAVVGRYQHARRGVSLDQDTTKALALFQLNTELYPASPNAYHSLGRGWLVRGDTTKAVSALETSLSLKPGTKTVSDQLAKIRKKKP